MEGDVNGGTVMAGQIAGMISKEQTCKEMIEEIMAQAGKLDGLELIPHGVFCRQEPVDWDRI